MLIHLVLAGLILVHLVLASLVLILVLLHVHLVRHFILIYEIIYLQTRLIKLNLPHVFCLLL